MNKLILLFLPILLIGCDNLGSKKIKNIVELTPKFQVHDNQPLTLNKSIENFHSQKLDKLKTYKLTSHNITAEPIFAKGVIYALDQSGRITAFSNKEKKVLWTTDLANDVKDRNFIGGGLTFNNDKLYITNGSRYLIVVDALSGHEIIRKEFLDIIRIKPVMLNAQTVLIQTTSNHLIAYDISSGKTKWQHEGAFEMLSSSEHIAPIVYNNQVLVTYNSGYLLSLDANTAEERWVISLTEDYDVGLPNFERSVVLCPPIIEQNNVYVVTGSNKIMKIDLNSGQIIWQTIANDVQSISLNGNNLLLTNNARQLASINTHDGKFSWVGELNSENNTKRTNIVRFLSPFVTESENIVSINILTGGGELYSFIQKPDGIIERNPKVIKVMKNILYIGVTCCGKMFLLNDKYIMFVD